eukprot:567365-Pyramimonas_sp.AAC.1
MWMLRAALWMLTRGNARRTRRRRTPRTVALQQKARGPRSEAVTLRATTRTLRAKTRTLRATTRTGKL